MVQSLQRSPRTVNDMKNDANIILDQKEQDTGLYVVDFSFVKIKMSISVHMHVGRKKRGNVQMSTVAIFWRVGFFSPAPFSKFYTMNIYFSVNGVERQGRLCIKPNHKKTKGKCIFIQSPDWEGSPCLTGKKITKEKSDLFDYLKK